MRNLILGLSLSAALIIGCLVRPVIIPPAKAGATATSVKWEYHCLNMAFIRGSSLVKELNKAGAQGWELIGADRGDWCLKRRRQP